MKSDNKRIVRTKEPGIHAIRRMKSPTEKGKTLIEGTNENKKFVYRKGPHD